MKEKIIELIKKGDLNDAFNEGEQFLHAMKDHYYSWVTLQSRYNDKEKENQKGILTQEQYAQQLTLFSSQLLDLVLKIDKHLIPPKEEQVISLKNSLQNKLLDSYEILEVITEGTSTVTYKAKELFDDDFVAIRTLKTNNLFEETEAFDEVQKIKKINHRNLLSILGKAAPSVSPKYVILEYVEGIDLQTLIAENGARSLAESKYILSKLCDALYYLHKRKIFNADLRASKILLDVEGEPIISPFIVFRTKSENTYNQIISNFKYMSYQRLNSIDYKHYDPRSNQFSLGTIAYLLIIGEPLFNEESLIDLIHARSKFELDKTYRQKKLSKLDDNLPLKQFIEKLLSVDRDHRFKSMFEVKEAIYQIPDNSDSHQKLCKESYFRACSFNTKLPNELVEKIAVLKDVQFPTLTTGKPELKLNSLIILLIESKNKKSYLKRIKNAKDVSAFILASPQQFKSILFSLLKDYDYLWSEELEEAWNITLDEILEEYS